MRAKKFTSSHLDIGRQLRSSACIRSLWTTPDSRCRQSATILLKFVLFKLPVERQEQVAIDVISYIEGVQSTAITAGNPEAHHMLSAAAKELTGLWAQEIVLCRAPPQFQWQVHPTSPPPGTQKRQRKDKTEPNNYRNDNIQLDLTIEQLDFDTLRNIIDVIVNETDNIRANNLAKNRSKMLNRSRPQKLNMRRQDS